MAETKPSWGALGIVAHAPLSEVTFGQILKKIDFELDADQEITLLGACERFKANLKIYPLPRRSNVKTALMAVKKRMKRPGRGQLPALLKMIHEMDTATRSRIATQESRLDLNQLIFQLEIRESAVDGGFFEEDLLNFQLAQLNIALKASLESMSKDRGGPSTDLAVKGFVERLAELYKDATKKPASSGLRHDGESEDSSGSCFFNFVESCLTVLGHRPQSRAALGKSIERILK